MNQNVKSDWISTSQRSQCSTIAKKHILWVVDVKDYNRWLILVCWPFPYALFYCSSNLRCSSFYIELQENFSNHKWTNRVCLLWSWLEPKLFVFFSQWGFYHIYQQFKGGLIHIFCKRKINHTFKSFRWMLWLPILRQNIQRTW